MKQVTTVEELRQLVGEARQAGQSVALVPTMGYLHAGHCTLMQQAKKFFPAAGVELAASRLGPDLAETVQRIQDNPAKKELVCECELVTLAEVETVAHDDTTFTMSDIRRRTRMGMGTCQGTYCGLRGLGMMVDNDLARGMTTESLLREFLETRWNGIRPLLWGNQVREVELTRGIYGAGLNMDGAVPDETE